MKIIKIYYSKIRPIFSILFFTSLLLTITFEFSHTFNKYIEFGFCVLLILVILFYFKRLIKPAVVIDSYKIGFPLFNEFVMWENIDKIEFNNHKNINESIEIKVKQIDKKRKKYNVPRVYYDYDNNGSFDFSLYRLDLEGLKLNNEHFYKFILDLSRKSKTEREVHLCNYIQ